MRHFGLTWDYRCPFARNAHEAAVTALRDGLDWEVVFRPFSLDQVHVPESEPDVWDRPPHDRGSGVLALTWGIAVRDAFADHFLDFHVGVFAARFDEGKKTGKEEVLAEVAGRVGLDPGLVAKEVEAGWPLDTLAREHRELVESHAVFGVPTVVMGDEAVFVRFMERGRVDDLERALDLVEWTRLNEFKRTRVPR